MFKSKAGTEFLEKMSWVADMLMFSILWFVFSIPIVTIGAATSATYRSVQVRMKEGNGIVWSVFWKTFKNSLPQATVSWLIYFMITLVFGLNQMLLVNDLAASWLNHFSQIFLLVVIILITPILVMVLAYISRFEDNLKTVWKNTFILSIAHFKVTLYVLVVTVISVSVVYLIPALVIIVPAFSLSKICPRLETLFNNYTDEDLLEHLNSKLTL